MPTYLRLAGLLVAMVLHGSPACAADEDDDPEFNGFGGQGRAVVELEERVPAPPGRITMYADFAARGERGVPIYLINRTAEPLRPSFNLRLEYRREDGGWERAEVEAIAFPGADRRSALLEPGRYWRFYGYVPEQGKKARVRYVFYEGATRISNEGEGLVAPEEVEQARVDWRSEQEIPADLADLVCLRESYASQAPPVTKRVAALRLAHAFGHPAIFQMAIQEWQAALAAGEQTAARRREAAAVAEVLARPWPAQPSPIALFERCVKALERGPQKENAEFGAPENEPELVWSLLTDLAQWAFDPQHFLFSRKTTVLKDPSLWLPVTGKIKETLAVHPEYDGYVSVILCLRRLVDETLSNDFFEQILRTPEFNLEFPCADVLGRRGESRRLMKAGWDLGKQGQLAVFRALVCPLGNREDLRIFRDAADEDERAYRAHCLETQPLEAAAIVNVGVPSERLKQGEYYPPDFHNRLYDLFLKEAEVSELGRDFALEPHVYVYSSALEVLGAYGTDEDKALLLRLLRHRGYEERKSAAAGGRPPVVVAHIYPLRAVAARALKRLGVALPAPLEREMPVEPPREKPRER